MNARLALLAALLAGCAALAGAAPAVQQAQSVLDTSRTYDGTRLRADAGAVFAGSGSTRAAAASETRIDTGLYAKNPGKPLEPPAPEKKPLTAWNPLLNGAKGAVLMGIVGFVLGGPLGMLVGAAAGGLAAWGLSKIGDA